ncbi:hypothetical protein WJX72_008065 [[Myrmecia] bisecta]|uniref:Uncharacterized protein n=1 Tax=[Myrmecia] bisecta TaxID=41462 RepID=A0AAW1Q760_9CHLO
MASTYPADTYEHGRERPSASRPGVPHRPSPRWYRDWGWLISPSRIPPAYQPLYWITASTMVAAASEFWYHFRRERARIEEVRARIRDGKPVGGPLELSAPDPRAYKLDPITRAVGKALETIQEKSREYGMGTGEGGGAYADGVFPNAKMAHEVGELAHKVENTIQKVKDKAGPLAHKVENASQEVEEKVERLLPGGISQRQGESKQCGVN